MSNGRGVYVGKGHSMFKGLRIAKSKVNMRLPGNWEYNPVSGYAGPPQCFEAGELERAYEYMGLERMKKKIPGKVKRTLSRMGLTVNG